MPGTRLPLGDDGVTGLVYGARSEPHTSTISERRRAGSRSSRGRPAAARSPGRRSSWRGTSGACMIASWSAIDGAPADPEQRVARFAELLETAIANADSRDQLTASRARLLTAADDARRRVVRDLHDGAQQRLVHSIITLKLAKRALEESDGEAADARRRGAPAGPAGQRRAARARARDPAGRPHARRAAGRHRHGRRADRPAGRRRHRRGPVRPRDRGERLLHRRRGAHERGQARARGPGRGARARRGRHPAGRGPRRRDGRRRSGGPWARRPRGPGDRARRAARRREPAGRRHPPHGRACPCTDAARVGPARPRGPACALEVSGQEAWPAGRRGGRVRA